MSITAGDDDNVMAVGCVTGNLLGCDDDDDDVADELSPFFVVPPFFGFCFCCCSWRFTCVVSVSRTAAAGGSSLAAGASYAEIIVNKQLGAI